MEPKSFLKKDILVIEELKWNRFGMEMMEEVVVLFEVDFGRRRSGKREVIVEIGAMLSSREISELGLCLSSIVTYRVSI